MQNSFSIMCFRSKHPQALRNVPINAPSIFYVHHGVKNLAWGDKTIKVTKKELLIVPPGQTLNFINLPENGHYQAWQFCLPSRLPPYISAQISEFSPSQNTSDHTLASGYPLTAITPNLALALDTVIQSKLANNSEYMQRHYMYGLVLALAQTYDISPLYLNRQESIVERVIQQLSWSPGKLWKVYQVADSLAMSESTLRRKLSEQGAKFRDLLLKVRLSHGLVLLQTGQLSLTDVAIMCGYSSHDRFARQFKATFGLSPRDYRKTCM